MKPSEIHRNNGDGLDDLVTWGTTPIKSIAEIFLTMSSVLETIDYKTLNSISYLIRDLAEDVEACLRRFAKEAP